MGKPFTIFTSSNGLNTQVDPVRLTFNAKTGVTELAAAYNIEHDETGRPSRRKGYQSTGINRACHSLFCQGGDALGVIGTDLCLIAPDLNSARFLETVTEGAPVSYAQVADRIYWMNGYQKGYVHGGMNASWIKGGYYGPTSKRVLSDPPIGTIVRYHAGHMYVAQANILWYSDPFNLHAFDLARNFFSFESNLSMVEPVTAGIYVGDDKAVYFLSGAGPQKFQMSKKTTAAAIKGTAVRIDLSQVGFDVLLQGSQNEGVLWASSAGIYLGTAEGAIFNLTKYKLGELSAAKGTAHVFNGKYVVCLAP